MPRKDFASRARAEPGTAAVEASPQAITAQLEFMVYPNDVNWLRLADA